MQLANKKCSDGGSTPPVKVLRARALLEELGQDHLHIKAFPNWEKRAQTLVRTFTCNGFLQSTHFVNRIAMRAEKSHHHPDIDIRFNRVTLTLTTHEERGITAKDFSLARQCDEAFSKL
jgi:4a-hydroxytetrahydrobiopterin dehydratase